MAVVAFTAIRPVWGAPADVFDGNIAAPVIGADPPKPTDLKDGDSSVSTQTGALQYQYPVEVPPGRNGAVPKLALSYSSQAPIYGGVAAGWSLSIPQITADTSHGRIRTHYPFFTTVDPMTFRFKSSLAGGRPLVNVQEPTLVPADVYATYRVQNDASYARYERMLPTAAFRWRVYSTDGTTSIFGGASSSSCTNVSEDYAPLTQTSDPFGNTVTYTYAFVNAECRISRISYGANAAAGLANFARVDFDYDAATLCGGVPVGSQSDYRTGLAIITGTARLTHITATAIDPATSAVVHTRQVALGYDATSEQCVEGHPSVTHAPVRLLTSLAVSASSNLPDSLVALPPVTFQYGSPSAALDTQASSTPSWSGGTTTTGRSLAWGYRFNSSEWPTLEAAMIDMDGDGLLDRVTAQVGTDSSGAQICQARWEHNSNGGFTTGGGVIDLPRLKWNGTTTALMGPQDDCALNGQRTYYLNSSDPYAEDSYLSYRWIDIDGDGLTDLVTGIYRAPVRYDPDAYGEPQGPFGEWPGCKNLSDPCLDISSKCMREAWTCTGGHACTFSYTAGAECIAEATPDSCSVHTRKSTTPTTEWLIPNPAGTPSPEKRSAYTHCDDEHFPWFIYKNLGNGVLATTPVIKYNSMPIEGENADGAVTSGRYSSPENALQDIDGDGVVDLVVRARTSDNTRVPFNWFVWLGDGSGGFEPKLYLVQGREDMQLNDSRTTGSWSLYTSGGLLDINGDGLLDQFAADGISPPNVAMNDGLNFRTAGSTPPGVGDVFLPSTITFIGTSSTSKVQASIGSFTTVGDRWTRDRMQDVDADGRLDVVNGPESQALVSATSLAVHFNYGGQFSTDSVALPAVGTSEARPQTQAIIDPPGSANKVWTHVADVMDWDGDGLSDFVRFTTSLDRTYHSTVNGPPRLMTGIDNGRGTWTHIKYDSMHSAVVTQDTTSGSHAASPKAQWVVSSISPADELSQTTATTSYHYTRPRYLPDDEGRYGFRGFDEVVTTSPGMAKTTQRYRYDVDWSGRLTTTLVSPAEAPTTIHHIDSTKYTGYLMFGGAITVFLPTDLQHFVCKNGQTEAACAASPATLLDKSYTNSAVNAGGLTVMYQPTVELQQQGSAATIGDKRITTSYTLLDDATNYRLRPDTVVSDSWNGSAMAMYAKARTTWDSSNKVKLTDEKWFDTVDVNRAITSYSYDMTTGNLLARYKPMQPTTPTTYAYDARKLFAATETDELSHQMTYVYDYGTGIKIETDGPNKRTCVTNPTTCPADATHPVFEQTKLVIDGLGRERQRWQSFSDDGALYVLRNTVSTSYVDTPTLTTPVVPVSMSTSTRLDTAGTLWKQERSDMDGFGRSLRHVVAAQGSVPYDEITEFQYANEGTLSQARLPDPTLNTTALVTYTYRYDSLGRATGIRRPDSTTPALQSGADWLYDGATQTNAEVAPGAQAATLRYTSDALGRLTKVEEQTIAGTPGTWATTTYTYAPNDQMAKVEDPESNVTTLTYDLGGRRTQISRGPRSWLYAYDKNGNLTSEKIPGGTVLTALDFTTSFSYDALDRMQSKVVGQALLTTPGYFASGTESFTYDVGGNGIGNLTKWQAFAPGDSFPYVSIDMAWDAQSHRTSTTQSLKITGFPVLTRSFSQTYTPFGAVQHTSYQDAVGGSNETSSTTYYDARALPLKVDLMRTGSPTQTVGLQTRNVAGLVTKRRTNQTSPLPFIESNWAYDKLGRVSSQIVQRGSPTTQIARQDLSYFSNDDPSSMTQYIGSTSRVFDYTFDLRHQLKTATVASGYFSAAYSYGAAGRFSHATESTSAPAGSQVLARDVDYAYDATDHERVTSLKNGATTIASYAYDEAGNRTQTVQSATGDQWDYAYDGKDQMRRAVKTSGGSEEYWYDDSGARFVTLKRDASGSPTELVWVLGDTEAHYSGAAVLSHVYSHISMGTPVARIDRTSNTATIVEYQFHGLGQSTLAAVDTSGTANTIFSYAPFGEVVESSGSGVSTHARRLNNKYVDELTGLAYYGARYYDKVSMTWTQGDPLYRFAPDAAWKQPRRANLYSFSLQNPLRYLDPDGMDPQVTVKYIIHDVTFSNYRDEAKSIAKDLAQDAGPNGELGSALASHGVSLEVSQSPVAAMGPLRGGEIHVYLVDTSDEHSMNAALTNTHGGAEKAVAAAKDDGDALGAAEINGHVMVLAVDRIVEKERTPVHGQLPDRHEKKKRRQEVARHEFGHLAGLKHTDPKKVRTGTDTADPMGANSLFDEMYRNFSRSQFDDIADHYRKGF